VIAPRAWHRQTLATLLTAALPAAAAWAQNVDAMPPAIDTLPRPAAAAAAPAADAPAAAPAAAAPAAAPAAPAPAVAAAPPRMTWELVGTHSELGAGLADGASLSLRGAIALARGDVLQLELVEENKFGEHGGVAAVAYTRVLSEHWYLVQTLVGGHGGPGWANLKLDTQVSRKWLAQRQLVSSVALYRAWLEDDRSDKGARLSLAWYLPFAAVLEGGVVLNISEPGRVHSRMPYAAVTLGREGRQYLSLRVARGTEAYQAIGTQAQLVDFKSTSVALNWRQWLGPRWGVSAQAEFYRNPTYTRRTLGVGLFVQI
jgi:YaiO family outer membrane protein